MRPSTIVLAGLALLATGIKLHASEATSSPDELRAARQRAEWQARQTKGGPQQLLLMKRHRISAVIDRLERGESVDPREIDHLLKETGRP